MLQVWCHCLVSLALVLVSYTLPREWCCFSRQQTNAKSSLCLEIFSQQCKYHMEPWIDIIRLMQGGVRRGVGWAWLAAAAAAAASVVTVVVIIVEAAAAIVYPLYRNGAWERVVKQSEENPGKCHSKKGQKCEFERAIYFTRRSKVWQAIKERRRNKERKKGIEILVEEAD